MKYIPTTERLPESMHSVLAIRELTIPECDAVIQSYEIAYIDGIRWTLESQQWSVLPCTPTIDSGIITHWMELPEKPSLEKGGTK